MKELLQPMLYFVIPMAIILKKILILQKILLKRLTTQNMHLWLEQIQTKYETDLSKENFSPDGLSSNDFQGTVNLEKDLFPQVNDAMKQIWPAFAVISGIDFQCWFWFSLHV